MKAIILFIIVILITGCIDDSRHVLKQRTEKRTRPATSVPDVADKATNAFNILIDQYANNIEKIWGNKEILITGAKDYVQYEDNLQTRVHINFLSGLITIETLSSNPQTILQKSIISTLLMSEPVSLIRTEQSTPYVASDPFLYGQVLDQDKQPIRWYWRAQKFADFLVDKSIKKRWSNGNIISYIEIKLVSNHINQRANKFLPLVSKASRNYGIDQDLILAIIEVESAFNPYAISNSNALGLMQVQPHTAGHDVFKQWGKAGKPSTKYLLEPSNNINMGTAYLALLKSKYLTGIKDPKSLRYATIVAYNGGAGSVLRTFSNDRNKAISIINSMSSDQVFHKLLTSHSSQESRNYLLKVNRVIEKQSSL